MKIAVASDHAGFAMKEDIKNYLSELGHDVEDCGAYSDEKSADYPDLGIRAAGMVASGEADRGILVCGTGVGMSITANKVKGVYAALCADEFTARLSREHNAANVLALGGRTTGPGLARGIVKAWLGSEPDGGRHLVRRQKIADYESRAQKGG
ncbi:MAG: ribose 5-phosphate isomerase B [Synergistaceae bacterium]|nr:ribose 5-phosphate isomerase B [Synergistaceae bacterium]